MARYVQKLSFGIEGAEWWVGWEIDNFAKPVSGLVPADDMTAEELLDLGVVAFQKVNLDLLSRIERRAVQRVRLARPYHGRIGSTEVRVIDLSAGGAGIAHERSIRIGQTIDLDFTDGEKTYSLSFQILRCQLSRRLLDEGGEARYYSSLKLRPRHGDEQKTLAHLVSRLLGEQAASIRHNPGEALALL